MNEPNKSTTVPSVDDIVLLPCPHCGSESVYVDAWTTFRVRCRSCDAMGGGSYSQDTAASYWNRRDGDPCREGCKIKRAVKEMSDSLTSDY
jgi:Lar family restriction alleviation protein